MNAPVRFDLADPLASGTLAAALPALRQRLRAAVRDGRHPAARLALAAIRRLAGPCAETTMLEAQLLVQERQGDAAQALLDRALATGQDPAALYLCRGEMRLRQQDYAAAAADLAEAVIRAPADPAAKRLLGCALLPLGRTADALACLSEAHAADPSDPEAIHALADALNRAGQPAQAAATLDAGIARAPRHAGLRVAAILLAMQRREHRTAASLAEAAWRDGVADACVLGLLGHARSSLGDHAAAGLAYAEARKLAPEDPYVRHLAAAAGLSPDAGQAAPEYVEAVFDGYAARFDAHLLSLGYRIPGVIRRELAGLAMDAALPVLDLGCGTGLVAVALSDMALGPMTGVDLSAAMLAQAARRGLYADLHHAEIAAFLATATRSFGLILAADVLPYLGDLRPLLRLVAARLAPGGRFLGSVEMPQDAAPFRLARLGRYQHSAAHLHAAAEAAGLAVRTLRDETVRLEGQAPVAGSFAVLERRAA